MVWLLACATPSPLIGETLTEDGSWRLSLGATAYDQGAAEIALTAHDAQADLPAAGLSIYARPGMDTMEHSLEVRDFVEVEPGTYQADLSFDMAGLWALTGYAGDESVTEGFTFVIEVLP